jgi:hypothetical protein
MAFFQSKRKAWSSVCWPAVISQCTDPGFFKAQPSQQQEDNVKYPQLQIKGLFQARYLVGMSKDVDVNGFTIPMVPGRIIISCLNT